MPFSSLFTQLLAKSRDDNTLGNETHKMEEARALNHHMEEIYPPHLSVTPTVNGSTGVTVLNE